MKEVTKTRCPIRNQLISNPKEIPNIFNKHFSSVGEQLASKMPSSNKHFSQYLNYSTYPNSFFFTPITPSDSLSQSNRNLFLQYTYFEKHKRKYILATSRNNDSLNSE